MWPYDNTRYGDRKEVTTGRDGADCAVFLDSQARLWPSGGSRSKRRVHSATVWKIGGSVRRNEDGPDVAVERREDDLRAR